jgi:phosphoglucomutase
MTLEKIEEEDMPMTREEKIYRLWLEKTKKDPKAQQELADIQKNPEEIKDRFYRELSFGTAGLRGILGMGTNRMNCYVVGRATQGLAQYLLGTGVTHPSAAIAYDSRHCSQEFAHHAACVFAANGVKVYLYRELMPTPALSFAVRELGCDTGVVITASHNPAAYNGFKAYDPTGCQIGTEIADRVQKEILSTDLFDGVRYLEFDQAMEKGLIEWISDSLVEQYLDRIYGRSLQPRVCSEAGLKLVYTPLNGAGNKAVRHTLHRLGIEDVIVVPQQEHPDGNFPTCPYPNPESHDALKLGLRLCEETGADLLLATDPDCDRVATAVRHQGEYRILTGNELGILMLDYLCRTRQKLGRMPEHPVAIRSVVSSAMADKVAASYGVELYKVLTGFKHVGEVLAQLETENQIDRFIFAFEESCGYLTSPFVRDKDGVDASLLVAEMACAAKVEGMTLVDWLEELYAKHGVWRSDVDNFVFEGASGMEAMAEIMERLRNVPPAEIAGDPVVSVLDYQTGREITDGQSREVELPSTNMIELKLKNKNTILIRPSGTEPKIKVYYTVAAQSHPQAADMAQRYRKAGKSLIQG